MIAPDFRLTENIKLAEAAKNFIVSNYSKYSQKLSTAT